MLKEMDVILFYPRNWFGKLIAWVTNSKYSHVAIVYDPENKLIVEAEMTVQFSQLNNKRKYDVYRYTEPISSKQIKKAKAYLSQMAGVDYDMPNLIDILINLFRRAFNRPYKRYWGSDDLPVCSELVANAFKKAGIDLFPDKPSWAVTPQDFAEHDKIKLVTE